MDLPLITHSGKPGMPVVLLIHGLGMNNYFWVDPGKSSVLGGLAPLNLFLAEASEESGDAVSFGKVDPHIEGLWHVLEQEGFSLASWSQSQPIGPIRIALQELDRALEAVRSKWPDTPIHIIGHSRGGLIARRYLLEKDGSDIAGFVTICSPHSGTGMAKFTRYLKPVGVFLEKIMPAPSRAGLTKALNRLAIFLQSPAISELEPGSEFIASIQKPLSAKMPKLSFGGTSPALFQIIFRLPAGSHKIVRFPDMLTGAISAKRLPRELTPGLGDALVSAASARLKDARHYDFPVNHVKSAYDAGIHHLILDFLHRGKN